MTFKSNKQRKCVMAQMNTTKSEKLNDRMKVKSNRRIPKTKEVFVIQGNYGQGWEDVTEEDKYSEARQRLREYDANENYPHRRITRRVENPEYKNIITSVSDVSDYDKINDMSSDNRRKENTKDWRESVRIYKTSDAGSSHRNEYAVTHVKKGNTFNGVDVDTKYFKTRQEAENYKRGLK